MHCPFEVLAVTGLVFCLHNSKAYMSELSAAPLLSNLIMLIYSFAFFSLCLFFFFKENIGKVLPLETDAFSQIIAKKSMLKIINIFIYFFIKGLDLKKLLQNNKVDFIE